MRYPDLQLPEPKLRPFFYANFVQTVDGKVAVTSSQQKDYWPIGSQEDWQTLIGLRAHADVLIHGSTTARWMRTLNRLGEANFQEQRKQLGKKREILYVVMSNHPDSHLLEILKDPPAGTQALLVTTAAKEGLGSTASLQVENPGSALFKLSEFLHQQGYGRVLIEGGPHLFASFLNAQLIDELFVTIAPKLFSGGDGLTMTMAEGGLFPAAQVPTLTLLAHEDYANELFLRYGLSYPSPSI